MLTVFVYTGDNEVVTMRGVFEQPEIVNESEAEKRFKDALQQFDDVSGDKERMQAALIDAEVVAKDIEDEERKAEAIAQVEVLKKTL